MSLSAQDPLSPIPLIDVRPELWFLAGHLPDAVGIPLEELAERVYELPPRQQALVVADNDPERCRLAQAILEKRGHPVSHRLLDQSNLCEVGPTRQRLWRPAAFLAESLDRMRIEAKASQSSEALSGKPLALDVACGSGRDAVYLALKGYDVEALDLLPDALARAEALARRSGVEIRTRVQDLESDSTLPGSRFHLIVVLRYLQRSLFSALRSAVAPGGYLVYETFHERNLQTPHKPRNPDHLLRSGELGAVFKGFELLIVRDEVEHEGRYFSQLLARRPL